MSQEVPIPLQREQVAAACHLCARLGELHKSERALHALQGCFPGFDAESSLLKVLALRAVYASQAFSALQLARHVQEVMARVPATGAGPELVDLLAAVPGGNARSAKAALALASRVAHFFVDLDRFPVLDTWSEQALAMHLVRSPASSGSRYVRFARDVGRLAETVGVAESRDLARYLWLAGQHRAWSRNPRSPIQRSVRELFETSKGAVSLLFGVAPVSASVARLDEPPPALPSRNVSASAVRMP